MKTYVKKLPGFCRAGSNLITSNKDHPKCKLNSSIVITETKLKTIRNQALQQTWELLDVAFQTKAPFQIITYEGMQQNLDDTFKHLSEFTGWSIADYNWTKHTRTAKISSEDLKHTILNYKEVEDFFQDKTCFLDMLHSQSKQISPLCNIP